MLIQAKLLNLTPPEWFSMRGGLEASIELNPNAKSFLPQPILRRLDEVSRAFLLPESGKAVDFSRPAGEQALTRPSSVSWRIFKNPVSLYIGGIAAVILELAEPRVRSGVWDHSGFRTDPVRRLRRTGLAAMITVYGARSAAEVMIGGVRRIHDRIQGRTPGGEAYEANDPELLNWVHATASFGFLQAYHTYVSPLSKSDRDRYYSEGAMTAALYGARGTATRETQIEELFAHMNGQLEPSPIIFEFLSIMRRARVLPLLARPLQPMLVRAAVSLAPPEMRSILGLGDSFGLRAWERPLIRRAGSAADRIVLGSSPAVQACLRLGLPADYLYTRRNGPDAAERPIA
jgi:uncharacterized protein (DUF2236 family)